MLLAPRVCGSLRSNATRFPSGERDSVRYCPGSPKIPTTFPSRSNQASWPTMMPLTPSPAAACWPVSMRERSSMKRKSPYSERFRRREKRLPSVRGVGGRKAVPLTFRRPPAHLSTLAQIANSPSPPSRWRLYARRKVRQQPFSRRVSHLVIQRPHVKAHSFSTTRFDIREMAAVRQEREQGSKVDSGEWRN